MISVMPSTQLPLKQLPSMPNIMKYLRTAFITKFILINLDKVFSSTSSKPRLSESAHVANPHIPGLSVTGIRVENELQKHIENPDHRKMLPHYKRHQLLTIAAQDAEKSRNHWHAKKAEISEKLKKSGRKTGSTFSNILSKIPTTLESEHKHAKKMKNEPMQILLDVARDSAIHHQHGHLQDHDVKDINRIKFPTSRRLGYITPKASPPTSPSRKHRLNIHDLPNSP